MKTIILKLGGSIFMPEHVDTDYLLKFKKMILEYSNKYRFIIIVGGGHTCRKYQDALRVIADVTDEQIDWMGIHVTELNAQLLKLMFERESHPYIITDPTKPIDQNINIIIGAGYKPGWSTDYDAMLLAKQFDNKEIIVLSNIKQIYSDDPKKNPDAKPIDDMKWKDLAEIVGDKWTPGLNVPLDPSAVKEGIEQKVKVVFADGRDLDNFKKILDGKDFTGTTIK
ncbi:UMP kinase [Candidatus Woesearchaeota archaeon]|nr:MAG: UMP kinase [Candidatus Woesearchaeota archaeon]